MVGAKEKTSCGEKRGKEERKREMGSSWLLAGL